MNEKKALGSRDSEGACALLFAARGRCCARVLLYAVRRAGRGGVAGLVRFSATGSESFTPAGPTSPSGSHRM